MDILKTQHHAPTCRACATSTDRIWARLPDRPGVPMCARCTESWEGSGEKKRADALAANATKNMNPEEHGRAMMDFIYRMQKERLESAGKAVAS